ncbi:GntR family transcriptional regulator, histidine utilization repressor [Parasphingorhabdus marina DSM 22363]|uniref:GntR family transcriptional regulator, histidine utilization repressor n=1 Tax=Parasphingorhabdus marina DSM 22363 TaxID=1123272 RepID=A0A1N6D3P4_9SPHN|nr:GntR family transcriptional regulator [Parasphingorhabdus marina]SIN65422.1 GntR family transcriptional regulator, histidine utilization repressor [Parasphingorhabdus marina DSM 22363]
MGNTKTADITDDEILGGATEGLPRYLVIKNHLLDQIRSGQLSTGDKAESENALAKRFDVSRLTVQRAVRELVTEGRLTRVQGSGTFVAPKPKGFSLFEVQDLAREIELQGGEPHTDVLIQRQLVPEKKVCDLLELDDGEPVFEAVLLQRNGDTPIAIEDRYARCDVFPNFLEKDFSQESLYDYFSRRTELGQLETTLSAIMPYPLTCQRLGLGSGDPCLHLERRNRVDGRVVTLSRFTFAGSRFNLTSSYNAAAQF